MQFTLINKGRALIILLSLVFCATSCEKYLEEKTLKTQFVPDTIEDLQALLYNNKIVNVSGAGLLEIPCDDYFIMSSVWESLMGYAPDNALNYSWSEDAVPHNNSWNLVYQGPIYYSNIVLDQLKSIEEKEGDINKRNLVKGSALFYRAVNFYDLAQMFCLPYSNENLNKPGIVLRLTSDINVKSLRSTVSETYSKIIEDLLDASELLPARALYPTIPTSTAAYAALARTYLCMRDYINAEKYVDKALFLRSSLMDFNSLIPLQSPPISTFNTEVIFHNTIQMPPILTSGNARIDSNLINFYSENDLRKSVYFEPSSDGNGSYIFKGSYDGNGDPTSIFNGITTSELFLIKAECRIRSGDIKNALSNLNALLVKRWKTGTYIELTSDNINDVKDLILLERRKELVFRGQRWSDLRRFNLEGMNITLKRVINGNEFTLPPGDNRWVMLMPFEVVNRSGISQNPR